MTLQGENPVYVWVPLNSPKKRRGNEVGSDADGVPELQVFLRLQWQTDVVRGSSLKVDAQLAGCGLLVMGGLQDELFHLSMDELRATAVSSQLELMVRPGGPGVLPVWGWVG